MKQINKFKHIPLILGAAIASIIVCSDIQAMDNPNPNLTELESQRKAFDSLKSKKKEIEKEIKFLESPQHIYHPETLKMLPLPNERGPIIHDLKEKVRKLTEILLIAREIQCFENPHYSYSTVTRNLELPPFNERGPIIHDLREKLNNLIQEELIRSYEEDLVIALFGLMTNQKKL